MTPARICLITPGHLSTNPRIVKEADALAEAGYDVTVIAADYLAWGREADRAFRGRLWTIAPPVPFGPLAPFATRAVQIARQRAGRLAIAAGIAGPWMLMAALHPAAPSLARAARRQAADLYIAHYTAALPAAALAARFHGAAYAFDAEDFHPADPPPGPGQDRQLRLITAIERAFLPGCAAMIAASPGIADAYAAAYGIPRPTVVLNVFPCAGAPAAPTPTGPEPRRPSLYWFSQTIGPDRGLECAIRAIAAARSQPHLFLRGQPAAGYRSRLEALAGEAQVADRLHFLPLADPGDMVRLAAGYDLGLVAETGVTENRRIALTNKQFTYLAAGTAVVMSDIPAHQALAPELGEAARLFRTGDPSSLAIALDDLLQDPAKLARARAIAFALGHDRFNWDVEKKVLQAAVATALASGPLHARMS